MTKDINIGDRISFRSPTRWADQTATRVVNGFYAGKPTVRYGGHPNFIVRHDEIIAINSQI